MGALREMIELNSHPYFVACQFHPEFKSKPLEPHPLFTAFIKATIEQASKVRKGGQAESSQRASEVAEA